MAFFNRKKNKKAAKVKPKAEVTFVETVCPSCSGIVNLNATTGEIFAGGAAQSEPGGAEPEGGASAALARRMPGNVRASIYSINCPHCGNDFVWDTDADKDGSSGQAVTKAVPLAGTAAPAPAQAETDPAPSAEAKETVCPNCGAQVDYDTATADEGTDEETGTEGYLLTCPDCNTEFIEPFVAASEAIPAGASAEYQAAYRAGVLAERNRQLALDEMVQAVPAMGDMIQAAKRTGASAETMSRNVIKAMAAGKGGSVGSAQFAAALGRDIKNSGVGGLRNPKHAAAPKGVKASAYERRIEEHNKARGGRDDA